MFRRPGESSSSSLSDDTSTMSDQPNDRKHEDVVKPPANQFGTMQSSTPIPTLDPNQHFVILSLSLIEKECIEKASNACNFLRTPSDVLAEDHPDVLALSKRLYKQATDDMKRNGVQLGDFAGKAGARLRNDYRKNFNTILNGAASKVRGIDAGPGPANSLILPFAQKRIGKQGQNVLVVENNSSAGGVSTYNQQYYELGMVGKGGYGTVYHVLNLIDNQHYAIKKVNLNAQRMKKIQGEACLKTLFEEVRTLATLNHPNIVRYYGTWVEPLENEGKSTARGLLEDREHDTSYYTVDNSSLPSCSHEIDEPSGFSRSNSGTLEDDTVVFEVSSTEEILRDFECLNIRHSSQQTTARRSVPTEDPGNEEDNNVTSKASGAQQNFSGTRRLETKNYSLQASIQDSSDEDGEGEEEEKEVEFHKGAEDVGSVDGVVKRNFSPQASSAEAKPLSFTKYLDNDGLTLFIKMSLHPLTLSSYISPGNNSISTKHCFHTIPTAKICLGILDGIEYLHNQNIVHRDLKPANILLSIEYNKPSLSGFVDITGCPRCKNTGSRTPIHIRPCVSDFGLVAKLDPREDIGSKDSNKLIEARRDALAGTRLYRPPDMPTDEPSICPKLDIYALGITAVELVMKFNTESERRKVLEDLRVAAKYPDGFDDHEMAEGIKNMLNRDRNHRWNAKQVRYWLEELLNQEKLG